MTVEGVQFQSDNDAEIVYAPSSFVRLLKYLANHAWFIRIPSHIQVSLSPSQIYQILELAAKPSIKRLGLRNLFARSRRYHMRPTSDRGFRMTTTSRVSWHPRRRTSATAILTAKIQAGDDNTNQLNLNSRVKLRYLLTQFFLPTFFASMIIFMSWATWIIVLLIISLYSLSWIRHRTTAMLEVQEMIFFIETILREYVPEAPAQLQAGEANIVLEKDFAVEWDKYVAQRSDF